MQTVGDRGKGWYSGPIIIQFPSVIRLEIRRTRHSHHCVIIGQRLKASIVLFVVAKCTSQLFVVLLMPSNLFRFIWTFKELGRGEFEYFYRPFEFTFVVSHAFMLGKVIFTLCRVAALVALKRSFACVNPYVFYELA